jgi:murein DD-endopeptidase MepM/ murein hydrolase activator NlpD
VCSTERDNRTITLANAFGNYATLDLGLGRFADYAHLQPRRFSAKLRDKVREGQALALLGNSGNSDAPRLRFQLVDADSPFGSEFKGRLLGGPVRVTRVVETRG